MRIAVRHCAAPRKLNSPALSLSLCTQNQHCKNPADVESDGSHERLLLQIHLPKRGIVHDLNCETSNLWIRPLNLSVPPNCSRKPGLVTYC